MNNNNGNDFIEADMEEKVDAGQLPQSNNQTNRLNKRNGSLPENFIRYKASI